MLQTRLTGPSAIDALESVCTADVANMRDNTGALALFTNEHGGIYDDLIANRIGQNELYIVSNASMEEQDWNILSGYVCVFLIWKEWHSSPTVNIIKRLTTVQRYFGEN